MPWLVAYTGAHHIILHDYMHPYCVSPLGEEPFGQPFHSPRFATKFVHTPDSSLAIVPMFVRGLCATGPEPSKNDPPSLAQAPPPCRLPLSDNKAIRAKSSTPQSVIKIAQLGKLVPWLADKEVRGRWLKGLHAIAVDKFPAIFSLNTRNANFTKAAS